MRVSGAVLALAGAASGTTGCGTLIGAGIGSTVPRWGAVAPDHVASYQEPGEPLEIEVTTKSAAGASHLRGVFGGWGGEVLVVATDDTHVRVPLSAIDHVDVRTGSYLGVGLALGALVDVALVVLVAATWRPGFGQMNMNLGK